jgi:hypothetical protein
MVAQVAVVSYFKSQVDFLECNVNMGMDVRSPKFNLLSQRTATQLVRQFTAVRSMDARDGVNLMAIVQHSHLLPEHVAIVRDVVNGKVMEGDAAGDADDGAADDSSKKQSHEYFEEYLFEEQWSLVGQVDPALQSFAGTCRGIGLWHPNEKTIAKITALAIGQSANPANVSLVGLALDLNFNLVVGGFLLQMFEKPQRVGKTYFSFSS